MGRNMKSYLTIEEKVNLLMKQSWSIKDISQYYGICKEKATKIRNKAFNVNNRYDAFHSSYVYVDDVLAIDPLGKTTKLDILSEYKRLGLI